MQYMTTFIGAWHLRANRVGDATLGLLEGVTQFYRFIVCIIRHVVNLQWLRRPAVIRVLIRQLYFTGVESLPWVLLMSLAGATAVYSVVPFARQLNDTSLIGTLINALLVQEMAPLLVSIFLLARSGVAVVTELGHMHVRGENILLRSMGISVDEYLLLPRFIAFALCGLILTMLFVASSIWLGGLMLAWNDQMAFTHFLLEIRHGASLDGALLLAVKAMLYPLLCCSMLLFHGCRTGRNPNFIPVCTTRGVLWALMLMLFFDVLIALLRSLM
ncbi:MAG: ABC transporter permease [Mariprofundaceae bacterium]